MEYVLEATSLCKDYGEVRIIDKLSMHIPKGAIYGLVGKNGAGKTTLIRLICGLQKPTNGSYTIYGVDSLDRDIYKVRRRMGAMVEGPAIYLDMTAEDNLKQQCIMLGIPSYDSIPEILKLVGLDNTRNKMAWKFSLGMRQRLGIAIALIGSPDFLILDEPTNGLDPQGIIEMRELILKLNREKHITVLISSHILDELSRLATHYGFIDDGKLIKEISAKDLEASYNKCKKVQVSDTKVLSRILDNMGLNYEIIDSNNAKIYGEVSLTSLVLAAVKENCEIITFNEQDESLESYFINLVGGGKYE